MDASWLCSATSCIKCLFATTGTITVRSPSPEIPIEELSLYTVYSNITVYAPHQRSCGFLPASKRPDSTLRQGEQRWSETSAWGRLSPA